MAEFPRLVLKAFRSLSEDEQETLVREWFGARPAAWLPPGELMQALEQLPTHGPQRVELAQAAGMETGGPWQSVPVRLSTEQHERLKQWCQANGFTMAVVLRGLVARFLDDQAGRRPRSGSAGPGAAE
ncbi:MAG TPA: hypothetical protein VGR68_05925 [Actinomycetota bacterium]|jgi:hypothetical protein|nr:hypothetical protein [Actinomycetota bacterium]